MSERELTFEELCELARAEIDHAHTGTFSNLKPLFDLVTRPKTPGPEDDNRG